MENEKRLDLIDRNAVLDLFTVQAPSMTYNKMYMKVANAPTVDAVEVVHGRWDKYARYTICSVCDIGFCYYKNETDRFRYCPNCGAKMDGDGYA